MDGVEGAWASIQYVVKCKIQTRSQSQGLELCYETLFGKNYLRYCARVFVGLFVAFLPDIVQ